MTAIARKPAARRANTASSSPSPEAPAREIWHFERSRWNVPRVPECGTLVRVTHWRAQRAATMRVVVRVLAWRPALLGKLLEQFTFRKALGAEARLLALRSLGAEIGEDVFIGARVSVRSPENLTVGDGAKLEGTVRIDSWQPVRFGRGVIVSDDCVFLTSDHDVNSPHFTGYGRGTLWPYRSEPLTIGDYAWLPRQVTVLRGANIGEGAVAGVGSIVTRPVEPWTIVAGSPARKIGTANGTSPTAHPRRVPLTHSDAASARPGWAQRWPRVPDGAVHLAGRLVELHSADAEGHRPGRNSTDSGPFPCRRVLPLDHEIRVDCVWPSWRGTRRCDSSSVCRRRDMAELEPNVCRLADAIGRALEAG